MGWLQDLLQQFTQRQSTQKGNNNMATFVERITGGDRSTWTKGRVAGTDLGIPFWLPNGSYGYLFGDSFESPMPGGPGWRSPTAFRSAQDPTTQAIVFDSAYMVPGNANGNIATPDLFYNQKSANDFNNWGQEFSVIPNDGISFGATGDQLVSFMSINRWRNNNVGNLNGIQGDWRTNYNALAYSKDGNTFTRLPGEGDNMVWWNNEQNTDPFQMMSFADGLDGYVYALSVRAGRQVSPVMLQRVPWDKMFYRSAWQGWNNNGGTWHWGGPMECTSILPSTAKYGEPSFRRLIDGTYAMTYWTPGAWYEGGFKIVSRTSPTPMGPWSAEKVQVTAAQESSLYGGFIHPISNRGTNKLNIFVSKWGGNNYHVNQYRGTL